jgi:hypothetical protein
VDGIKWDLPLSTNSSRTYSITFEGEVSKGEVVAAVKDGNGAYAVLIPGPACPPPAMEVEKAVVVDGGAPDPADNAPGPEVTVGSTVSFHFTITNNGDVPLTNVVVSDPMVDTSACVPGEIAPGASYECDSAAITVEAESGQMTNTVTVTAMAGDKAVSATDWANYFAGEITEDTIIVIEGPVENININIITNFGMNIQVDPNDPVLTEIVIGDNLRIEGSAGTSGNTIIIVAVTIVFVDVDIIGPNIPPGCKITGKGHKLKLKCSKKGTKKSSKKS